MSGLYSANQRVPESILAQVAHINHESFEPNDTYNTPEGIAYFLLTAPGELMIETGIKGKVHAYLFYKRTDKALESERLAVTSGVRRKGLARKLLNRALKRAGELELDYTTYCLHDNLASINMRYGMGFAVTKIDSSFIYFVKKYKETKHDITRAD